MNRYSTAKIGNRWDGKRVYKTTIYPRVALSENDIWITAGEGDYLDTLAFKYYKDPTMWWVIANANNIGKGRLSVPTGLQIRIPMNISKIIQDLKAANR